MNFCEIFPLHANRVWRTYPGGRTLDLLEGKSAPNDSHFSEDWIGSVTRAENRGREHLVDEGLSLLLVDGRHVFLHSLIEEFPTQMLGEKHLNKHGADTGFLLKFLDSAVRLHIQCHPTREFSRKHLNSSRGKTEGYIILGTREEVADPYIYFGFQRVPEKEDFREAILTQDVDFIKSCFEKIPVKPGDVFLVPGGQPHAIGAGIFMMEIMEPTDFAVRIEFERGGYVLPEAARFMGRDIDFALSMFKFNQLSLENVARDYFITPYLIEEQGGGTIESLFDSRSTDCFSVQRLRVNGSFVLRRAGFFIAVVVNGVGRISCAGKCCDVRQGGKFFVPCAVVEIQCESDVGMEIILAGPSYD